MYGASQLPIRCIQCLRFYSSLLLGMHTIDQGTGRQARQAKAKAARAGRLAVRCAAATQRVYRNRADTYNRNGDRRTLGFRDSGLWAAAGSEAQAAAWTFNLPFGHTTCLSKPDSLRRVFSPCS